MGRNSSLSNLRKRDDIRETGQPGDAIPHGFKQIGLSHFQLDQKVTRIELSEKQVVCIFMRHLASIGHYQDKKGIAVVDVGLIDRRGECMLITQRLDKADENQKYSDENHENNEENN